MAEPASIVKCRRFCRRTSLHFNRGMQKPVQPVAVEINFSPPSAMCGVGTAVAAQDTDRDLRILQGFMPTRLGFVEEGKGSNS